MTLATALISALLMIIVLASVAISIIGIDDLLRETPEEE